MFARMRRDRRRDTVELNITAFLNLMVALVPFLLITAVFTQLTIKELSLPDSAQAPPETPPEPGLTVTVRAGSLSLSNGSQVVDSWPAIDGRLNTRALTAALVPIKERKPAEDKITLLLEPDISYDNLIQVMDAVHYLPAAREGVLVDMFPQISIGDAPVLNQDKKP